MRWFKININGYYLRGYLAGKPLLTTNPRKALPMGYSTCLQLAGFLMKYQSFPYIEIEPCLD